MEKKKPEPQQAPIECEHVWELTVGDRGGLYTCVKCGATYPPPIECQHVWELSAGDRGGLYTCVKCGATYSPNG